MSGTERTIHALLNHYSRIGFGRHLQSVAMEIIKKSKSRDPVLLFWRAYGLMLDCQYREALQELSVLRSHGDVGMAACQAMIEAHQHLDRIVDDEAIADLRDAILTLEASASDIGRMLYARVLALQGFRSQARDVAEALVSARPSIDGRATLGWALLALADEEDELALAGENPLEEAFRAFDDALAGDPSDLDSALGKACAMEKLGHGDAALQLLQDLAARHPWFTPCLEARATLCATRGDWEACIEQCQRVLQNEPRNLTALVFLVQHGLTQEGCAADVLTGYLRSLADAIDKEEPQNAGFCARIATMVRSLAWKHREALNLALNLADRARKASRYNVEYAALYVDLALQLGKLGEAKLAMTDALTLDALNIDLMLADVRVKMAEGDLDDAKMQMENVLEMSRSLGGGAKVLVADAQIKMALRYSPEETAEILEAALGAHLDQLAAKAGPAPATSPQAIAALEPATTLDLVDLLLVHVGGEARTTTEPSAVFMPKCLKALEILSRHMGGHRGVQLVTAHCAFLNRDLAVAQRKVQDLLVRDPRSPPGHFLMARLCLAQGKPEAAIQGLEQALSQDLGMRDTPQFLTLTAQALLALGKVRDAVTVAEQALRCRGVRPSGQGKVTPAATDLSLHDRCAAYLTAVEAYNLAGKKSDAAMRLDEAKKEFENTPAEIRTTIASSQLLVSRGEIQKAIELLSEIGPASPFYIRARVAIAAIYLKHKNDPQAYAQCYREVLEQRQDVQTFLMLGEAYMQIQEPELAVEAMEQALKRNPRDVQIARRICGYLVSAHEYLRAIDRYRAAIRNNPNDVELPYELAQLYIRLGNHVEAKKTLELVRKAKSETMESLMLEVKALRMLVKSAKAAAAVDGLLDPYLTAVAETVERQQQLLTRMRNESHPDLLREQKEAAALIHLDVALMLHENGRSDDALQHLQRGLQVDEGSEKLLMAFGRVLMESGQLDRAQEVCQQILSNSSAHPEAALLLGEIYFNQESYEQAIYQFTVRLQARPADYPTLARCLHLLRRAGKLEDAPRFLNAAERADPRASASAGLRFCKALHAQFAQKPSEALQEFNAARRDSQWANESLIHMAEIYLNMENLSAWATLNDDDAEGADGPREIPDLDRDGPATSSGVDDQTRSAVNAARRLLEMVRLKPGESATRFKVLHCYALMGLQDKVELEQALKTLLELAARDRDHVPLLLALATAFLLLGQSAKARNQLKRISKLPYRPIFADEFERSWLLLTDIYMRAGKYDLAQELCTRCLRYNKSCSRAWEYSGQMLERESAYKDAAEHYERAWSLDLESSPQVGYRLAFNYLKAKRLVDAIDVCHKVLKKYPDFPGMKKDILDRAREGIRP